MGGCEVALGVVEQLEGELFELGDDRLVQLRRVGGLYLIGGGGVDRSGVGEEEGGDGVVGRGGPDGGQGEAGGP